MSEIQLELVNIDVGFQFKSFQIFYCHNKEPSKTGGENFYPDEI